MYLSIRDDILHAAGYPSLAAGLKALDIPGIELFVRRDNTVPALSLDGSPRLNLCDASQLAELKGQLSSTAARVSALCMDNDFNAPDRQGEIDWVVRTARAAASLGAPVVRIDAIMSGERHLPLEERQAIVAAAISDVLEATPDLDVDFGIENHGFQGNDPEFLLGLLERVDSTRLGLTLDSGNFYWRGWPLSRVYQIFEEFAPVVKHTHIKNIAYPAEIREVQREMGYEYGKYVSPIHEGDIDLARYIQILRAAGYERDICLEDESLGRYATEARQANLKAAVDYFRPIIAGGL